MKDNIYKNKIDEIIESHFQLPEKYPSNYIDYDEPHDDDIEAENGHLKELANRTNFLNDLFDHVKASPKHKEKFGSYYCFLNEAINTKNQNKNKFATNYSETTAKRCITELIESAQTGTTAHYLTGSKGAGKTFFVNYLLSYYREEFIAQQVVYVRTSLLKRETEEHIVDRVARQSLYILAEYYFKPGHLKIQEFEGYLRVSAPDILLNGKFKDEIQLFLDDYDYSSAPLGLFKYLHKYITSEGYNFLFVIDGLDAVEPTTEEEARFTAWFKEVMQFAIGELPFSGAWLFVARDESYRKHFPLKKSLSSTRSLGQFKGKNYKILPTCLFTALKKRAEYQAKVFKEKSTEDHVLGVKNIHSIVAKMVAKAFSIDKLHTTEQGPKGFVPRHKNYSTTHDHEIYEKLSDVFAGDMRKAFCACHVVLLASISMQTTIKGKEVEYINSDDTIDALVSLDRLFDFKIENTTEESMYLSQVYRLVHPFICGLNLYCVPPFEYQLIGEKIVSTMTDGYDIESGTMPNLYQMDMDIVLQHSNNISYQIIMSKFAKIIILIYFYKFSFQEGKANSRKSKHLIDSTMKSLFAQPIIDVAMNELIYFNALKHGKGCSKSFILTDGGQFFAEYFLWNSDYLACVMNTIAVPMFLFESENSATLKYLSDDEVLKKLNSTISSPSALTLNCKRHFNRILFARYLEWSWNECIVNFAQERNNDCINKTFEHITTGLSWLKEDAINKAARLLSSHQELSDKVSNDDFSRALANKLVNYKYMIIRD